MRYFFFAPVANVGGHFRSIKLADPFKVERWPYQKIVDLYWELEGETDWEPDIRVDNMLCVPYGGKVGHVVTADVEIHGEQQDNLLKHHKSLEALTDILETQFRQIRLLVSGQAALAAKYWYNLDDECRYSTFSAHESFHELMDSRITIGTVEAAAINHFLEEYSWPPRRKYVEIAIDHWEASFVVRAEHLRLVSHDYMS